MLYTFKSLELRLYALAVITSIVLRRVSFSRLFVLILREDSALRPLIRKSLHYKESFTTLIIYKINLKTEIERKSIEVSYS